MSSATTLGNRQRVSTAPRFVRQLETWLVGLNADFLRPDLTPIRREVSLLETLVESPTRSAGDGRLLATASLMAGDAMTSKIPSAW
jgi:hypothetical protein